MTAKRHGADDVVAKDVVSGNVISGNVIGPVVQAHTIHGGVHLHSAEPPVMPVVTPVAAQGSGHADLFVGRAAQVEEVLARLEPDGEGRAVVVSAGMGGVGKTALALRTAALAVRREWFTGAALLVDLRGYEPDGRTVASHDVFAPLLRALDVETQDIPENRAEQAAVYHRTLDRLGRKGRRVLLVLDNASSGDQVRDLLPRHAAHRALVTTRDRLSLPDGNTLVLEALPAAEARTLLERALRNHLPDDPRVAGSPRIADRLVTMCGALPLAVRIVAAILADEPDLPLTALVDELRMGGELRHGELSVAAAVDVSWRRLLARDPSAARLAQLCTLNPGPGLETEAAQALDGRCEAEVRGSLRTLRQAHLLSKADGHWQMHDLVRQQLRERAMPRPADEPAAALTRLLEYYLQAVSRRDAEWFESERVTLVAAVPVSVATGLDGLAADLAAAVCAFLTEQCDLGVRLVLCRHEAEATARSGDARRRAEALARLGTTLVAAARFSEGLSALDDALETWRAVADAEQVAEALHTRGLCLVQAARHRQAVSALRESAQQFRALELPLREAQVLDDLAETAGTLHDLEEALSAARRSAALFADTGERQSELHLGVTVAALHARNGRYALAVSGIESTARVAKNEGYPEVEARACAQLALLHAQTGRQRTAAAYRQRAVALLRQTGDTEAENLLTMQLSASMAAMADDVDAASALQQQVEYCRSSGNRNGEGDALHRLGLLLSDRARLTAAYQVHLKAVEVWRDLGNRHREGAELAALAKAFAAVNRLAAARRTADEAIEALTDSGAADEAAALRDWAAQLPPSSEDEPEELSYATTVTSENVQDVRPLSPASVWCSRRSTTRHGGRWQAGRSCSPPYVRGTPQSAAGRGGVRAQARSRNRYRNRCWRVPTRR